MTNDTTYTKLTTAYAEWLQALNYEKSNADCGIRRIQDFTSWLREKEITNIEQIRKTHIENYFEALGLRINPRTGTALSISSLKAYSRELNRFARYLRETGQGHLEAGIKIEAPKIPLRRDVVFTYEEIKKLYDTCTDTVLGLRDRAMLSVYYGCGLRRTEGVMLEIRDVQFNRGILHVRKGKNYKERYVPMTGRVISDLTEYYLIGRPELVCKNNSASFFISYSGCPLGAESMNMRFNNLKINAGIEKEGSLHSLRHSIATHLLQRGMGLEQIARFLGHSCMESTQIYTHILNETEK